MQSVYPTSTYCPTSMTGYPTMMDKYAKFDYYSPMNTTGYYPGMPTTTPMMPTPFTAPMVPTPSTWAPCPTTFGPNTWANNTPVYNENLCNVAFRPNSPVELYTLTNPIRMIDNEGNRQLYLCFELKGFKPEEVCVTLNKTERAVVVEAAQDAKDGKEHQITRKYSRKFVLPETLAKIDLTKVELKSCLTQEGFLVVECPLPKMTTEEIAKSPMTPPMNAYPFTGFPTTFGYPTGYPTNFGYPAGFPTIFGFPTNFPTTWGFPTNFGYPTTFGGYPTTWGYPTGFPTTYGCPTGMTSAINNVRPVTVKTA